MATKSEGVEFIGEVSHAFKFVSSYLFFIFSHETLINMGEKMSPATSLGTPPIMFKKISQKGKLGEKINK